MEQATDHISEIEISAVVIRTDGARVDLGIIDAYYDDPDKRAAWDTLGKPWADFLIRQENERVAC